MTREEFDHVRRREGYGDPNMVRFAALSRSEPHIHDKVSFVFVLEGDFILSTAKGAARYQPGETCILEKDIEHAEDAGPAGAAILVARKQARPRPVHAKDSLGATVLRPRSAACRDGRGGLGRTRIGVDP